MNLSSDDFKTFLQIHLKLLYYTGHELNFIKSKSTFEEFVMLPMTEKYKCRNGLLDNEYLLEQYIAENLDQLSTRDINILTSFKKRITGDFIIVKCLKKHAIFIHAKSNKMYTVYALNDTFDSF